MGVVEDQPESEAGRRSFDLQLQLRISAGAALQHSADTEAAADTFAGRCRQQEVS